MVKLIVNLPDCRVILRNRFSKISCSSFLYILRGVCECQKKKKKKKKKTVKDIVYQQKYMYALCKCEEYEMGIR